MSKLVAKVKKINHPYIKKEIKYRIPQNKNNFIQTCIKGFYKAKRVVRFANMKRKYIQIALLAAILYGCVKEDHETLHEIRFISSYEPHTKLRHYFLPAGTKALLTILDKNRPYLGNITEDLYITSDGSGYMFSYGYYMTLRGSTYDIFSLSESRNFVSPLVFYNNRYTVPENGVDYIWAAVKDVQIHGPSSVNLLYRHIASKIDLTITTPHTYSSMTIRHIKLSLPNPSASCLDLENGIIYPVEQLTEPVIIDGYGNSREIYLLPCLSHLSIEVSYEAILANGQEFSSITRGTIPVQLQGGIRYEVNVDPGTYPEAMIKVYAEDWVNVPETIEYSKLKPLK